MARLAGKEESAGAFLARTRAAVMLEGKRLSKTTVLLARTRRYWQTVCVQKLQERNGHSRNGMPKITVERQSINSMHWYEAIREGTRDHVAWLLSVTHYTGHAPKGNFLLKWYADLGWDKAEETKKAKGKIGSEVHNLQEKLDWGEEVETKYLNPIVAWHLKTYADWVNDIMPQFVANEEIVHSLDEGVAGTADKRYVLPAKTAEKLKVPKDQINEEIDGIHVLHDSKTGKALYEDNWLQANKYADLRNQMGTDPEVGVPVEWVALLRTNTRHKCGYEFVVQPISDQRTQVFNCLKSVVDHYYPMSEPKFPAQPPRKLKLPE